MEAKILSAIERLKNRRAPTGEERIAEALAGKKVVIYGAGAFGTFMADGLQNYGVHPVSFLDRHIKTPVMGIPVVHPEEFASKDVVVLLAIVLPLPELRGIFSYLHGLGFSRVIDAQELNAMNVPVDGGHSYASFKSREAEILRPLAYLCDLESRETYAANVAAHILRDYQDAYSSNAPMQYFVDGVVNTESLKRFVDCGAYVGDTFAQLLAYFPEVEFYAGFEPMAESFTQLVRVVADAAVPATLFPLAVSDKAGISGFNEIPGTGALTVQGGTPVATVSLDQALHHCKPGFIKMDIEGGELAALHGAKNLILGNKPDMAICVYHCIDHFWSIPNLLHDWSEQHNLGYRFFLRAHSSACSENVLYAIKA